MGQARATVDEFAPYRPDAADDADGGLHGDVLDAGLEEADAGEVLELGRQAPFSMVPDWIPLSGISANAQALYVQLLVHLNVRRGDRTVFPSRAELAARLGKKRAKTVDPYIAELIALGAIDKRSRRIAGGMRARNHYVLHQSPPPGYTGPISLAEYQARRRQPVPGPDSGGERAGRPVVPSTGQPRSSVRGHRRPVQRTTTGWPTAPRKSAGGDGNNTKNNQTNPSSPHPSAPGPASTSAEEERLSQRTRRAGAAEHELAAEHLLRALPLPLGAGVVATAVPVAAAALAKGWSPQALRDELTRDLNGVRSPGGVVLARLRALGDPPPLPAPPTPACPLHPGAARRGMGGECSACWSDRQE